MLRLSIEGALGIAAALILFVLDKMGIGGTPVYILLFLVAAFLCVDSIARSDWGRSNKHKKLLASGLVSVFYLAFGYWIFFYPHSEPEMERKIDELLASRAYSPEKLREKYPLGYFIFELEYVNNPEKARLLKSEIGNYELDWTTVKFQSNTRDSVGIYLPDVRQKTGKPLLTHILMGGTKKVGNMSGILINDMIVWGEILQIRQTGIVFLVGFTRSPNPSPDIRFEQMPN